MENQLYPLHPSQQRIFFDQVINPKLPYFNIGGYLVFKGNINVGLLKSAIISGSGAFDIFQFRLHPGSLEGRFYLDKSNDSPIQITDIDFSKMPDSKRVAENWSQEQFNIPFDIFIDTHLSVHYLLRISDTEIWYFTKWHHILMDGFAITIWMHYISKKYRELLNGENSGFRNPSYFEFINDYFSALNDKPVQQDIYWNERLGQIPERAFKRKKIDISCDAGKSDFYIYSVSPTKYSGYESLKEKNGIGIVQLTIAALTILFSKSYNKREFVFGIPIHKRNSRKNREIIGMFTEILPYKSLYDPLSSASDYFKEILSFQNKDYRHQNSLPDDWYRGTGIDGASDSPFDVLINYVKVIGDLDFGEDVEVSAINMLSQYEKSPLSFWWIEYPGSQNLFLRVDFSCQFFSLDEIILLIDRFDFIVSQLINSLDKTINTIEILPANEINKLASFNNTRVDHSRDHTITDLFAEQVKKTPDSTALIYDGIKMTYAELDKYSNQLAHYLHSKGVVKESLVPICLERGIKMIVGILGILKAGGACVPIDPGYPAERIRYMLTDTGSDLMISSSADLLSFDIKTIDLDRYQELISQESSYPVMSGINASSLAYVLYTSGTTGNPKGVMIEHKNVVNLIIDFIDIDLHKNNVLLSTGSPSFDISIFEYWSMLLNGGRLILCSEENLLSPEFLKSEIQEKEVKLMFFTTSFLNQLIDTDINIFEGLTTVLTGGEKVSEHHIKKLLRAHPLLEILNAYGPTENTVISALYKVDRNFPVTMIPIGHPLKNRSVYVLDKNDQLVPIGVPGEIYVGGDGVARGYLNLPGLTTDRFFADPFSNEPHARMYRTGDTGRWLPDGNIDFIGRKDDQVKIRGYRIEPGEIENVLKQSSLVSQAVVIVRVDEHGNKRLVGYVVAEGVFNREEILMYLRSRLPEYMVPAILLELDSMPLTANGKIDKKSLPDPGNNNMLSGQYAAPRNRIEQALAQIWQELLGITQVGIYDNFFELGGHSLLAVRLISAIRQSLSIELSISEIFNYPVLEKMALQLQKYSEKKLLPAIIIQERPLRIPLSFSQERLWFIDQFQGSVQYHVPVALRLKGNINIKALSYTLVSIVNRHESLRTVFRETDGVTHQEIMDKDRWQLDINNISAHSTYKLNHYISSLIKIPFDLTSDHMLRAHLLQEKEDENILVIIMHHIACDGWSISIIVKELTEFYSSYIENRPYILAPLPLQYADFSIWQQDYFKDNVIEKKLLYWKDQLSDVTTLNLPTDYPRPAKQNNRGSSMRFWINKELTLRLEELSRREGATLFMTLLSAFYILLYRYSNQEDICVGSAIAGRQQKEIEGLVGFFVNMLVLRGDLSGQPGFRQLLQRVGKMTLEAYENQEVPFERIVEMLTKERDMSRSPLFQVAFILQNIPEIPSLRLGEVSLVIEDTDRNTSLFDLNFSLTNTNTGLQVEVEYNSDLFTEATIKQLVNHYSKLLESVINSADECIDKLPMLNEEERSEILNVFNDTHVDHSHYNTITDLFAEQVKKTPDSTALIYDGIKMTYAELDKYSNQLAHYLHSKGVVKESLVPICLERGIKMIVGILGILKAGGACVPIDPGYPAERIRYMLTDTGSDLMISSSADLLSFDIKTIDLDRYQELISQESSYPVMSGINASSLAYVLYTSGTTGNPKGVMIEHKNVVNLIIDFIDIDLHKNNVLLSTGSPSFDISIFEYWSMLLNGGRLILCSEENLLSPEFLKSEIQEKEVKLMFFTTSFLNQLIDTDINIFEGLTTVLTGGEKVSEHHIKKLLRAHPLLEILNAYGPTENTVISTLYKVDRNFPVTMIPIGHPLKNRSVYVLDKNDQLVPIGVSGEIYVGGDGVARGYLNLPGLTTDRFFADPFSNEPHARMYRTGDTGRWLPDGNIDFIGRKDDQVKIRGYRIEPGEIENVLKQSSLVSQAVVIVRVDEHGNKRLVGYVVAEGVFNREEILMYLRSRLPEYMVPAILLELDSMPLTANGKIDKKSLPDPGNNNMLSGQYAAPRNRIEQALAQIWQELLGITQVGIYDNFFELGGHSLLAVRLISAIRQSLSIELSISEIFNYPVLEKMALQLHNHSGKNILHDHIIMLNSPIIKQKIFLIPGFEGTVAGYEELANQFNGIATVCGIQTTGINKEKEFLESIHEIAATNIKWIKEIQEEGPYIFLGHSFGGKVVYEMTKQLEMRGETVKLVILLDVAATSLDITKEEKRTLLAGLITKLSETNDSINDNTLQQIADLADLNDCTLEEMMQQIKRIINEIGKAGSKPFNSVLQMIKLQVVNSFLFHNYRLTQSIKARTILVKAKDQDWTKYNESLGWEKHIDNLKITESTGGHRSMIQKPNIDVLAHILIKQFNEIL